MSDEVEETEGEDEFMVTGRIIVEAGMTSEGDLQWRWKREDIEPALALGFVSVIEHELKCDIASSPNEGDDDEDDDEYGI
jgi:hypothetical protein